MDAKKTPVLVIGLDGASFDIIAPLIKEGKLPYLKKFLKNGSRANLKSTIMPNSFPAWTSCITGMNPGKHGIFWSLIRNNEEAFPMRLMNSSDIHAKAVWEILGDAGHKVCIVNIPVIYPPTEVNGCLICGALTPGEDSDYTFPKDLKKEILTAVPHYKCEIEFAQMDLDKLANQIMGSIQKREQLALYLLEKKSWDLFFIVFTEPDLTQHKFWGGIDEKHPDHKFLKNNFSTFVYDVYERLDRSIERICKKIPEETIVFVISDHGFGPLYQTFSILKWLIKKEYMVLSESLLKRVTRNFLAKINMIDLIRNLKTEIHYFWDADKTKANVRDLREKESLSLNKLTHQIKWDKTRAYFTSDNGIRINLKGREPFGIVNQGAESESLIEKIKSELCELKYSNGEPVFEAVLRKEEVYSGPFVERAPDLIVPINHYRAPLESEKWEFTLHPPKLSGAHSPLGIFLVHGNGIQKGKMIDYTHIIDIAPTILYIFNESTAAEMDGKVLLNMFEPEFIEKRQLKGMGSSHRSDLASNKISESESEKAVVQLRELGYLD